MLTPLRSAVPRLDGEADTLARSILDLVRRRAGRLAAASVRVPAPHDVTAFADLVAERLGARGLPDIAIHGERGVSFAVNSIELDR